jgi:methylenetetrahydrofolate dehydrogenase (NADP+)/methenyltetrahydrofolate cyclohydrolase
MNILDGKHVSQVILSNAKQQIEQMQAKIGRVPGLAVIIAGNNPASASYVKSKAKKSAQAGIHSTLIEFDAAVSEEQIIDKIIDLNQDASVDGILVQLPLPGHLNQWKILDHIHPKKDVDCFHPLNQGRILLDRSSIFPCTPAGIIKLLDYYNIEIKGLNAAVIGRSFIVGKPMAALLTNRHATVTLCHSRTRNLPELLRRMDLIVSAVGIPDTVTADMVTENVILIDVGINHIANYEDAVRLCDQEETAKFSRKGYAITGDISKQAFKKSSWFTPVPGGVGLMTVALLIENTVALFNQHHSLV